MKTKLKAFEKYNGLNAVEKKDLLRDINLELAELKQEGTDLRRDSALNAVHNAATSLTVNAWRIKAAEVDHRSGTLNNHAEYLLILLARGK